MNETAKKYQKKPLVVEAIQWTGGNLESVIDFLGLHESANEYAWEEYVELVNRGGLKVFSGNRIYWPFIGDYIIKKEDGLSYAMRPDTFLDLHEPVKAQSS